MEVEATGHRLEELRRRLAGPDRSAPRARLAAIHPPDLARVLRELPLEDRRTGQHS